MVEWDCILEVLRLRGLGERWISWIKNWLYSDKMQIMVNREKGKEIVLKRGLRQRDPLSPVLLFVLCCWWFEHYSQENGECGLVQGLIGSASTSYVNLQYADNTLIFGGDSISEAIHIKWRLYSFEAWSGLRINFSKNSFICLGPRNLTINLILEIFRCK